jgi:hypothetical protein
VEERYDGDLPRIESGETSLGTKIFPHCARLRKVSARLRLGFTRTAQGPQGFYNLLRVREEKSGIFLFLYIKNKWLFPCGPCAANNDATKSRNYPCAALAQPLRKAEGIMAEHAFERFRRLRGLTKQESSITTVVQESTIIEDGVLVEEDKPSEATDVDQPEGMTPLTLLRTLHARGIRIMPYPGGQVRCRAPEGAWTPALLAMLNAQQATMADMLEAFEERAAIGEFCGGMVRPEAEQLAWQCVLGESPKHPPPTGVPGPTKETTP